jgi:hypothetical protein
LRNAKQMSRGAIRCGLIVRLAFEALRSAGAKRLPVASLIDDVRWACPRTRALRHHVLSGLIRRRCLFLLTYRADEASDQLRELLSAPHREKYAWIAAADSAADLRARARRLIRGGLVAWDVGRLADAYKLLDAADCTLADVAVCAECARC